MDRERRVLGAFDLAAEGERLPPGDEPAGRRAETLVKEERLRVVLVTMRGGAELREHSAPGPITIQALRGRFAVDAGGERRELPAGTLLALAAGAPHAVRALEDGAFLLTIGWAGGERASTMEERG
jgi:quercetin dioxygenase-like cupin family protein